MFLLGKDLNCYFSDAKIIRKFAIGEPDVNAVRKSGMHTIFNSEHLVTKHLRYFNFCMEGQKVSCDQPIKYIRAICCNERCGVSLVGSGTIRGSNNSAGSQHRRVRTLLMLVIWRIDCNEGVVLD